MSDERSRILGEILRSTRITGSVYFCDTVTGAWRKQYQGAGESFFHFVRKGQCRLSQSGAEVLLERDDLVLVAPFSAHRLSSPASISVTARRDEVALLCGYCAFDDEPVHPLIKHLPPLTVVRRDELKANFWLESTLEQLSSAYAQASGRGELVVDKLTEILFAEIMRIKLGRGDADGFIGALFDRPVLRTLSNLHADPRRPWTIEAVASRAGISRAALAKRFKERVGQPINQYLTELRMRTARDLLRGSDVAIPTIANSVGYESDLAFARAFKRVVGITPSRFRMKSSADGFMASRQWT